MLSCVMSITLDPDQEAWLRARVASGEFASVDAAARQLLAERIAEVAERDEVGDLAWAKPYGDEGLTTLDRGEVVSLKEHKAQIAALLTSMK